MLLLWPTFRDMMATLPPGEQAEIAALLAGTGTDEPAAEDGGTT